MEIFHINTFSKAYKKLHVNQLITTREAIESIIKNPKIGEQKNGDLAWLRVYKFKMQQQVMLLGYSLENRRITLVALAPHENFYRNVKK